ncbi:MAG: transposase [Ignavibacteria bacterium RIFOXYD12_FULL_36_8]|nr:MAG: transposase [Ignavibacteria bacterium RIFOXYD12_FULL_36_8]
MNKEILDLYTDYLISSTSKVTATGLSELLDNEISHDKVTRFLSEEDFTSKELWKLVKPLLRKIESEEGCIIVDDSVEEKAYTDENDLICWNWDHCFNRAIKGVNQMTAIYYNKDISIPVVLELIKKTKWVKNKKTGKDKRISELSKQEIYKNMLRVCVSNQIKFKYVLNDSWFSSSDNMKFVKKDLKKDFIMPIKDNRQVALSLDDKRKSNYQRVDSIEIEQGMTIYIEGLDFPLRLCKKVFKRKDGSEVSMYLVSSDLTLDDETIGIIYEKRWKIEEFHESMKSNCSYTKSPTHTVRTQLNHFFCSVYSFFKLECMKIKTKINHFALKRKIYMKALKIAFSELQDIKAFSEFSVA